MAEQWREQRLHTQRIYTGRAVALDVDRIRLPNGRETTREIVRHPGSVVIIPVLDEERVLLIRQFRYAVGEVLWEFPAGTLDRAAESAEACAHRELEEETGYRAGRLIRLGEFFTAPGFTDERMHVFQAEDLRPAAQQLDSDELIEVVPLTWESVYEKVRAGEIRDGKTLAALYLYALRRRA
ncbi:ADP-ribose pyrophosphatase [bacterium HR10]|nr:ADP-ribose pyrophosphatase [bacterium HR10]